MVKSRALARGTVRVVLSVVDGVVLWWQLYCVILIKVWSSVTLPLGSGKIYAVEYYFLALGLAVQ